jgi:Zn-dependent protease with chaperone function
MTATGPGTFYDGLTSARRAVTVTLDGKILRIASPEGAALADWPVDAIAPVSTPNGVLRLGLAEGPTTARLQIHDAPLAAAVIAAARPCDRTGLTDPLTRLRVATWGVVAAAALIAASIWVVPYISDRITPHLPVVLDQRLGTLSNAATREELASQTKGKPFVCGAGTSARAAAGRAAFAKLVALLEGSAGLPLPLDVTMVHVDEVNAITLPGGFVYVYEGLLSKATRVDHLAGVMAHELGHVNNRDGSKAAVQNGGLSLLFGMLLGDFTGGGAVVLSATKLLTFAYSRKAETAADRFGAELMVKIGGDPHALSELLLGMSEGDGKPEEHFLLDHPEAEVRAAAINRIPQPATMRALLTPEEWTALKAMCQD